jgi:threonine/homoserine/homoserine lactone efflux protein
LNEPAAGPFVFYLACYLAGFLLCFPVGAASLEMLRLALAGRHRSALMVAAGAGLACGGWASVSFLGVRPLLRFLDSPWVEGLFLGAATVLLGLFAALAWRDSRRSRNADVLPAETKAEAPAPLAQVGKGVLLGLVNPQTIASWVLILSLFNKAGFRVPPARSAWFPFFLATAAGYETFFVSVIRLARRLKFLGSARSRAQTQRGVAVLFMIMALLCAYAALRVLRP